MKWLNIDRPLGSGNPYAPNAPCIWPAIIGAVGGIASAAIGSSMQSGFTKEQQKLQSRLNREEMNHSMALQRGQQEWLMNTQYGKSVSGMKNAGLNPATANGVSPATPSAGHPSTGSSGPSASMPSIDVTGAALDGLNIESLNEDIKAKQIDNKRKELLLKDEENASNQGYREEKQYLDPDTGEIIASSDRGDMKDQLDSWQSKNPNKTPTFQVVKHNRGKEQQRQQESEWNTQNFERESRVAAAQLDTAIKTGQLKEQDVMDAFIKLPANQRHTLEKLWREYDDNHDLAELQKELAKLQKQDIEATSFGSLVNTLKGDMGFGEKLFATLGWLVNKAAGNTHFSFGWSNKH